MFDQELIKGTLKTLVLNVFEDQGRLYGYELVKVVESRTQGKIRITEGALYPILHKLQREGLLEAEENRLGKRIRKYYELTESGRELTNKKTLELLDFASTLLGFIRSKPGVS